jgi:hypothetical protein
MEAFVNYVFQFCTIFTNNRLDFVKRSTNAASEAMFLFPEIKKIQQEAGSTFSERSKIMTLLKFP